MQAVVGLLRDRPRRRRPHHRQAGRLRLLARRTSRRSGATGCCRWRAPHPRTLEIVERTFTPEPGRRPAAGRRRPAADRRRHATCGRSAASPPGATSCRGAYASDICLVNWPMIDYFEGPVIDVPDAGRAPGSGPRAVPCRSSTGCRPRRRAPTAAPASPACGCAATSPARARRPGAGALHPRVAAASGPSTPWSSRTCRSRCAATRARSSYHDRVGVGMYRIDLHPSTGGDNYIDVASMPVRDPARRAAARGGWRTCCRRQEHRHHPHHQRLLPAAPGRVEHRRGRRRARRLLPRPRRHARARSADDPALLSDFQARLIAAGRRARAGRTSRGY